MRWDIGSRHVTARRGAAMVVGVLAIALPASAQSTLDWPVGEFELHPVDTGSLANAGPTASVVFETDVTVEDAAWLRLYFGEVVLETGSSIRMTSALDQETQQLDAYDLAMWRNTSAYFNGGTVHLELIAGPGTSNNRVVLEKVATFLLVGGQRACGVTGCGYCGSDNRVPSSEDWSGRLLPVGCTGSIYNVQSCVVSAGHCVSGGAASVIQFRVPNSQSNCNLVNPPVADQFPITDELFTNGGVGNDWAVMTSGTNNLGQTAYDRYGVHRPIASSPANSGSVVSVWGFGIDDSPSPTRNMTQQTHTGPINQRLSNRYIFSVDITNGNSGSGLIFDGAIIGIVTHCPCPNTATRVDLGAFAAAREVLCPSIPPDNDNCFNSAQACVGSTTGRTSAADNDGSSNCGDSNASPDVWYHYRPGLSGTATIDTCTGGNYDGVLSVHTAGCPGTSQTEIACDDDGCGPSGGMSRVTLNVTGGQTYLIRVTGFQGDSGDFTLNVSGPDCDLSPPAPSPMTWETTPVPISTSELSMTCTLASDDSPPIEYFYFFSSGGAGGDNSPWQLARPFNDTGLTANTVYTYQVRARDSSDPRNYTIYSLPGSGATYMESPTGISFGAVTETSIDLTAAGAFTNLTLGQAAIFFEMTPAEGTGANQWVQSETISVTGLSPATAYTFRVKSRNAYGLESPSPWIGPATQNTSGGTACVLLGDISGDGSVLGDDIAGFIRARLGLPAEPGENPGCADYGTGTIEGDTALFIADLLTP